MSSERDRARRLAEEIRAAVAAAAPEGTPAPAADGASPEEKAVRRAWDRAQQHLTPSIPPGARLSGVKRAALRALRFAWREQSAFNALALEAIDALRSAVERERRASEEAARAFELAEKARAEWIAASEQRSRIEDGRLARLESRKADGPSGSTVFPAGPGAASAAGASTAGTGGFDALPPGVYSLFEERFRGSPESVAAKQRFYLPMLSGAPGPVLDVGCGRGELLRLLRDAGVRASGVEVNPIAAAQCRSEGLDVEEGDAFARLSRTPPQSLGAVVALQVVEHWPPEAIFAFLRESLRVLAPGGLLVLETINVDSLSAWRAFFLDPSHVRPVPAEALKFLADAAGFQDSRIELLAPLPAEARLAESSSNDAKLNALLFAPQDYALIATSPAAEAGATARQ